MKKINQHNSHRILTLFVVALTFVNLKHGSAEQNVETYSRFLTGPFAYNNDNDQSIFEEARQVRSAAKNSINEKLATKSRDIASKAADEAKAASDAQTIAGRQAAHQVKSQLAEKASRAAKAAEAALAGKIALVEQLGEETKETQSVIRESTVALQRSHINLLAATRAAHESHQQLDAMRRALQVAKSNLVNSRAAAEGARRSLREKKELLVAAKRRVEELSSRMQKAKADLAKTSQAAVKAQTSAREAKIKINQIDPPSNYVKT